MSQLLTECPYCAKPEPTLNQSKLSFQVTCIACGSAGPRLHSRQDAILQWNKLGKELSRSREQHAKLFTEKLKCLESAWLASGRNVSELHS